MNALTRICEFVMLKLAEIRFLCLQEIIEIKKGLIHLKLIACESCKLRVSLVANTISDC